MNTLVALRLDGQNTDGGVVLAAGADFYACPELSATGTLAWMQWRHPAMPWDVCQVLTGPLLDGSLLGEVRVVAGGPDEAAVHPLWRGEELLFCSDRSGFWELYSLLPDGAVSRLTHLERRFGGAVLGVRPPSVRADGCGRRGAAATGGRAEPSRCCCDRAEYLGLTTEVVDCDSLDACGDRIVLLAEFADVPPRSWNSRPGTAGWCARRRRVRWRRNG